MLWLRAIPLVCCISCCFYKDQLTLINIEIGFHFTATLQFHVTILHTTLLVPFLPVLKTLPEIICCQRTNWLPIVSFEFKKNPYLNTLATCCTKTPYQLIWPSWVLVSNFFVWHTTALKKFHNRFCRFPPPKKKKKKMYTSHSLHKSWEA